MSQPPESGGPGPEEPGWPAPAPPPPAGPPGQPPGQPQWPAPMPVPPGAARTEPRYNPWLLVGIAVGTVVALFPLGFGLSLAGLYLLDSLTAQSTGLGVLALFLTALIIPVALLMVPRMKTSTGRSVWMGLALGTAVYLIVGGGLCVALVVGTYP